MLDIGPVLSCARRHLRQPSLADVVAQAIVEEFAANHVERVEACGCGALKIFRSVELRTLHHDFRALVLVAERACEEHGATALSPQARVECIRQAIAPGVVVMFRGAMSFRTMPKEQLLKNLRAKLFWDESPTPHKLSVHCGASLYLGLVYDEGDRYLWILRDDAEKHGWDREELLEQGITNTCEGPEVSTLTRRRLRDEQSSTLDFWEVEGDTQLVATAAFLLVHSMLPQDLSPPQVWFYAPFDKIAYVVPQMTPTIRASLAATARALHEDGATDTLMPRAFPFADVDAFELDGESA